MNNYIEKRIQSLVIKLNKYNNEYYVDNAPSVDDLVFDNLLRELIELEAKYPQYKRTDSPTNYVGSSIGTKFTKEKHFVNMLSLQNAFNKEDLISFDKRVKKNSDISDYTFVVEPKIDGVSVSLTYDNGILVRALTRGDGMIGENIFSNVIMISEIPKKIELKNKVEIKGEIYFTTKNFDLLNHARLKSDLPLFINPRNAASGTLRQLDSDVVSQRNLSIFLYSAFDAETKKAIWDTQLETLLNLRKLNFPVSDLVSHINAIEQSFSKIDKIQEARSNLDYEIDGIVIKVNENRTYSNLGYNTKFPRGAIAYKFPAEIKKTKLLDIFVTIGRTGRVTYNAKLERIKLAGSNVERATLHNRDYIKSLDLRIGDYVYIKKAGDIIPKVINSIKTDEHYALDKWEDILICPACNHELISREDEVDSYCVNKNCSSIIKEKFNHFVSKNAMNIDGFSIKQIEKFIDEGFLEKLSDIYLLEKNHKDDIEKLAGYKDKSINKLFNSITESKKSSLDKFIFGLGIRFIGQKSSLDLAKKYNNLNVLLKVKYDTLLSDKDFGKTKAKSITKWFSNNENLKLLENFIKLGINPIYENDKLKIDESNFFYNKKIIITGKIEGATREEIIRKFENLGSKIVKSYSKKVNYLIAGSKPSINKTKLFESSKIIVIKNINEISKIK